MHYHKETEIIEKSESYVHMYTYVHTYIHIHMYTHTYIHTYIHFFVACQELRQKRQELGLDATAKALFLCDDADQHRNPAYKSLRDLWMKENNAIILGSTKGDPRLPDVPGKLVHLYIHLNTYIHICTYTYTFVHMYICTYIHVHQGIFTILEKDVHTYVHMYIHAACMHTYICMYICTYIHEHVYV